MSTFRIKKVTEPMEGLIHLHFENRYDVCSTFMRVQEFYESPYEDIKGKYFTIEDYMDTYADDTGNFTYTTDWSGFNVPGNVVEKFYDLHWTEFLNKEKDLYTILKPFMEKYGKEFYVIGTFKEDTIDHEVAHAMYYLQPDYQRMMDNLTKQIPNSWIKDIYDSLKELGYCDEVLKDEVQAYLATSSYWYLLKHFNTINFPWLMIHQYRATFKTAKEKYCE